MTNSDILRNLNQRPVVYYPVYRSLTGSLSGAILLSHLMYWFSVRDSFYHTNDKIMEETGLTEDEMKLGKNRIKKLDFITITREGLPARTIYTISWEKYEACMKKAIKTQSVYNTLSRGCKSPDIYKDKESIKNSISSFTQPPVKVPHEKTLHPRWRHFTQKLMNAISTTKQVNVNANPLAWDKAFHAIHKTDGIAIPRIRQVLNWYCKELPNNDPFLPVAFSGPAFRKKFLQLEASIVRMGGSLTTVSPSPKPLTSPWAKKAEESMASELEGGSGELGTLSGLVMDLENRENLILGYIGGIQPESLQQIYTQVFITNHFFSTGYAMWIRSQIREWKQWAGDFAIFATTGKHWARYVKDFLTAHNMAPKSSFLRVLAPKSGE